MTERILADLLEQARSVPSEAIPSFLGRLEEARVTALARLQQPQATAMQPDKLRSVEEAAERLAVSPEYLYRNSKTLPFARRVGRRLLFTEKGIADFIQKRR